MLIEAEFTLCRGCHKQKFMKMNNTTLFYRDFDTKLGTVRLAITTNVETSFSVNEVAIEKYQLITFTSKEYEINLYECVPKFPIPHRSDTVENSMAWVILVEKLTNDGSSLNVVTKLNPIKKGVSWGADTGEGLNAILIEDTDASVVLSEMC